MTTTVIDPISPDLKQVLRTLKLGKMLGTLPERLALAKQQRLSHAAFLKLVLADEADRRETNSARLRARTAGLDLDMRLETWDESSAVRYDHALWNDPAVRDWTRTARETGGFLLLVGDSSVGKTRLLYEFARTELGDFAVLDPDLGNGTLVNVVAESTLPLPKLIVWLDELQRFLDGPYLTPKCGARAAAWLVDKALSISGTCPARITTRSDSTSYPISGD
jgi:hypothetical protein